MKTNGSTKFMKNIVFSNSNRTTNKKETDQKIKKNLINNHLKRPK